MTLVTVPSCYFTTGSVHPDNKHLASTLPCACVLVRPGRAMRGVCTGALVHCEQTVRMTWRRERVARPFPPRAVLATPRPAAAPAVAAAALAAAPGPAPAVATPRHRLHPQGGTPQVETQTLAKTPFSSALNLNTINCFHIFLSIPTSLRHISLSIQTSLRHPGKALQIMPWQIMPATSIST